ARPPGGLAGARAPSPLSRDGRNLPARRRRRGGARGTVRRRGPLRPGRAPRRARLLHALSGARLPERLRGGGARCALRRRRARSWRAHHHGDARGARAGPRALARRLGRRHRGGGGAELRPPAVIRRPGRRALRHPRALRAQHAGPPGRRDRRRPRSPRLRADARNARAAHPPRARYLEHLHEPGAVRPCRDRLPLAPRAARAREPGPGELPRRGRRRRPRVLRVDEPMFDEPLIFERGSPGRVGWPVRAAAGAGVADLPADLRREDELAGMPEVSELEVLRHFLRLSQWNYSAATTLYPLGSCTMKYNPVVNEEL